MTKKQDAEAEGYVKNYQLDVTNTKIDSAIAALSTLSTQVSDFQTHVLTRATNEQVDDKIAVAVSTMQKDLETAKKEIKLELGPPVRTSNRLLWALLSSGLAIFVALIMVVIGFFVK